MKLDKDAIVEEAVALLNEGGLAEVSLRKLAARLGARAPSLAWHVGDKEQLLTLMSERIFRSCLDAMGPTTTWQEWLREFGHALWRRQCETRDVARLIAATAPTPEQFERLMNDVVRPLEELGVERQSAIRMQLAVQTLVTGWTTFAQSARSALLNSVLSIEQAFAESLDALIAGLELRRSEAA